MKHSCRKAAELVSLSFDRRLRLHERVRLRLHLRLCRACRRYAQQLTALRAMLRSEPVAQAEAAAMPPDVRERLRESLRRRSSA